MKTARRISVMFLATVALAACSSDPEEEGNAVPSSWIRQEYTASGADYADSSDLPSEVAQEIHGHTASRDRIDDDGMVFLRYRDDIVAISPYLSGSLIEIADYRSGYYRWQSNIRSAWPDPNSDAFRGGGPGSGK
ncbi:DUF4247 domain-containing protein [Streptomyces sp. NPDC000410]|uniref:DUF4247 domain-containing protein n=1 Tax=Streptomyces sp. NPDC000410 TaxID=3154254 RepID=UPI00332ADF76